MYKIEIITRQERFESLKDALNEIGVRGMTVSDVLGMGLQKGITEKYRGADLEVNLLPKVKVEVVIKEQLVNSVTDAAVKVLKTGKIGDGKIFVSKVEKVIRVRTGEIDEAAL